MKMEKAKIFWAAAAVAALSILALSLSHLSGTGLFGLGGGQQAKKATTAQAGKEKGRLGASLSLEVLEKTMLEAEILPENPLKECPEETETEILLRNSGSGTAEKVFLKFGPGIKVIACENCSLAELKPGQEFKAKARLCLESGSAKALTVGSANSNSVELIFE